MNVTFLSYSDDTGLIRSVTGYIRMRTNDLYLVLSKDFGVYYVNHVEKKTQYEAPTCRSLQIAKRNSQTTPPIPESQDSQFMEWRANRIEPENPYRNGTYQRIPEFLHVYTKASREERNKLDWNMFSEYELERKDMIWSDLDAYDVIFRI